MKTNFKPLPQIELFDIELLKKVIDTSSRFYIVNANDFNKAYSGDSKYKKKTSIDVRYEDWYSQRIAYQLNYYNVTELVICQSGDTQYVVTAQLFLLLTKHNLQAKITLENNS